jgi:hypothetical protein
MKRQHIFNFWVNRGTAAILFLMPTLAYQVINQESAPVPIHLKHLKALPELKFSRLIKNIPHLL